MTGKKFVYSSIIMMIFLSLFIIGCGGIYYHGSALKVQKGILVTTTAASETDAIEGAKKEATKYCKEHGATDYTVIEGPTVSYEGPDKKGVTGVLGGVSDAFLKRDKSKDYKCIMVIEVE